MGAPVLLASQDPPLCIYPWYLQNTGDITTAGELEHGKPQAPFVDHVRAPEYEMTRTRFPDPYDGMSNDELDRHFSNLLISHRQRQQAISIRFPADLLAEPRRLAGEVGVGYQTLIKDLLERDVAQLRVHGPMRGPPAPPRVPATARRPSQKRTQAVSRAVSSSAKMSKKQARSRPRLPA
jgi:predicted DNA binding CopG/RHH family protein